jgi:hypothetical protein
LRDPDDLTYDAVGITSWSVAEMMSGILCAALPTLRPFFGRYIRAFATQNQSVKKYQMYGSGRDRNILQSGKSVGTETGRELDLEMDSLKQPYPVLVKDLEKAMVAESRPGKRERTRSAGFAQVSSPQLGNNTPPVGVVRIQRQWSVENSD